VIRHFALRGLGIRGPWLRVDELKWTVRYALGSIAVLYDLADTSDLPSAVDTAGKWDMRVVIFFIAILYERADILSLFFIAGLVNHYCWLRIPHTGSLVEGRD